MLRADRCIIKTSRNRMGSEDISVIVLQEITFASLEYPERAACKPCCMSPRFYSLPPCLNANHAYFIIEKGIKKSDSITPTANTSNEIIRKSPLGIEYLLLRFFPNNGLKVSDHNREGMRSKHCPSNIMGRQKI